LIYGELERCSRGGAWCSGFWGVIGVGGSGGRDEGGGTVLQNFYTLILHNLRVP